MTQTFSDRLASRVQQCRTPLVVGLDPRLASLPELLSAQVTDTDASSVAAAFAKFCNEIIDVVAPSVPAVKPQVAFFEQYGPAGMTALWEVIGYAREQGLLVIVDGKRNDIGSTAMAYAGAWLGGASAWRGDALTVSPYLGDDSLVPFVDAAHQSDAGLFVLVKTSNPGGAMLQDLRVNDVAVYSHVARHLEQISAANCGACGFGSIGAVAGATWPGQLAELRMEMPHCWFLVPGFGAQGGTAADVSGAFDDRGLGAVVNSSRGIIFAHARPEYRDRFSTLEWQRAVEAATNDAISQLRAETPAGRLGESGS